MPLDQVDRVVRIHEMLDPPGTSLKSVEELIEALQAEVKRLRGRVVADGLKKKARVVEVHVPAGHEVVVRRA